MNEVAIRFNKIRKDNNKRLADDVFNEIHEQVKVDMNVPAHWIVKRSTVYKRIYREKIVISSNVSHGGHTTPLLPIEGTIVDLIITLGRIKHAISPSEAITLINCIIIFLCIFEDFSWKI